MNLTIIMYHYVRPLKNSNYPKINGLELEGFKRQLDFFIKNYKLVTAEEIIEWVKLKKRLPDNAIWLTFDDGYKDHFKYVLPELLSRNIQGTFFPPSKPILENTLLDVNAIHYILSKTEDISILLNKLKSLCIKNDISNYEFENLCEEVTKTRRKTDRFDNKEELIFKRMLQKYLPIDVRGKVTKIIFEETINQEISDFSKKLYMNIDEIKLLIKEKMFVGSHTFNHFFLDQLNENEQNREIVASLNFLKKVGADTQDWIMCYPFGNYNKNTLKVIKSLGCKIGVTINPGVNDLSKIRPLELNRFDTNDFPQ